MAVRINLNVGDDLDSWISAKAESLGIAKNAFVIMCVANARNQEQSTNAFTNMEVFKDILSKVEEDAKKQAKL